MSRTVVRAILVFVVVFGMSGALQAQVSSVTDPPRSIFPFRTPDPVVADDDVNGFGFGKKIAGSWLGSGEFSVDFGCDGTFDTPPIPFTDAHTFEVGGAHLVTNPANPNSGNGTWTKTGMKQVMMRDINFSVDVTPGGTLTFVSIVSMVANFDDDFQTATTDFGADVFLPTQDPLNDFPIACSSGTHFSFRKVSATE